MPPTGLASGHPGVDVTPTYPPAQGGATCTQGATLVNYKLTQHSSPHQHTQAYYPTTGRNGVELVVLLLVLGQLVVVFGDGMIYNQHFQH